MMDLVAETSEFDLPTVTRLQQLKTGALLGAAIETIHGRQTGRTRLELAGSAAQIDAAVADLQGQGLTVNRVREAS